MISVALCVLKTEGERNELAEFYKKNKRLLYNIAYSKLHKREYAEDAVQETFSQISDKPGNFFGLSGSEQTAFASVITRNISIDMYKKLNQIDLVEFSEDLLYNDSENPTEEELLYRFSKSRLTEFIAGLPPLQRDILYMRAVRGMSIREIAEKLRVSENVVRQRLFQARLAIKKELENGGI